MELLRARGVGGHAGGAVVIRLALLLLLAYLLGVLLFPQVISDHPSPWLQLLFLVDLLAFWGALGALMARLTQRQLPES